MYTVHLQEAFHDVITVLSGISHERLSYFSKPTLLTVMAEYYSFKCNTFQGKQSHNWEFDNYLATIHDILITTELDQRNR
jgi:hypothetical protein